MTINPTLQINALLFGILSILILFVPLGMYLKEFSSQYGANLSAVEKILKVVFLQILIVVFSSVLMVMLDHLFVNNSMKPSNGLKYFYGYIDQNGAYQNQTKPLWKVWIEDTNIQQAGGNGAGAQMEADEKNTLIVWFKIVSLVIYLSFLFLPLGVLVVFFGSYFRSLKNIVQGMNYQEKGVINAVLKSLIIFVGSIVLLYVHLLIASVFVKMGVDDSNFSFYNYLSNLWRSIIAS